MSKHRDSKRQAARWGVVVLLLLVMMGVGWWVVATDSDGDTNSEVGARRGDAGGGGGQDGSGEGNAAGDLKNGDAAGRGHASTLDSGKSDDGNDVVTPDTASKVAVTDESAVAGPQEPAQPLSAMEIAAKELRPGVSAYVFRTIPAVSVGATMTLAGNTDLGGNRSSSTNIVARPAKVIEPGSYVVPLPAPYSFTGHIEVEGFEPIKVSFTVEELKVTDGGVFNLVKASVVYGRVVDAEGKGVAGAAVSASRTGQLYRVHSDAPARPEDSNEWEFGSTDENGYFAATLLPQASLSFVATAPGLVARPAYMHPGTSNFTMRNPLLIRMSAGGKLAGAVTGYTAEMVKATPIDEDWFGQNLSIPSEGKRHQRNGNPSIRLIREDDPGATGIVVGTGQSWSWRLGGQAIAPVFDGRYSTQALSPGRYYATISIGSESEVRVIEIHDHRETMEDWAFGKEGLVRGAVTRRDGSSVGVVTVYAVRKSDQNWKTTYPQTKSDAQGRFEFRLGTGAWGLRVLEFDSVIPSGPALAFPVTVKATEVVERDIRLDMSQEIPVWVKVLAWEGADFREFALMGPIRQYSSGSDPYSQIQRQEDGWISMGKRVPGVYRLAVSEAIPISPNRRQILGSTFSPTVYFTVPDGVQEYREEVTLTGSPLEILVLDYKGVPQSGVSVSGSSSGHVNGGSFGVLTDDQGKVVVPWVTHGHYALRASKGGLPEVNERVTVPRDGPFVLTVGGPTGSLFVKMVGHTGPPLIPTTVVRGSVSLYKPNGDWIPTDFGRDDESFGPVGTTIRSSKVPVGRTRVSIRVQGFRVQRYWVEIAEGAETVLEVTLEPAALVKVWLPPGEYTEEAISGITLKMPSELFDTEAATKQPSHFTVRGESFKKDAVTGQWLFERYMSQVGHVDLALTMPGYQDATWLVSFEAGKVCETTVTLVPVATQPPTGTADAAPAKREEPRAPVMAGDGKG